MGAARLMPRPLGCRYQCSLTHTTPCGVLLALDHHFLIHVFTTYRCSMPPTIPSILYLVCLHCGLRNIPERRTCKRCQTALDPALQVRIPAPGAARTVLPRGCTVLWLAFLGSMGLLVTISMFNPRPATVPTPGSPIFFRGRSIMLLRMVVRPPYEAIELYDDGEVSRYTYPIDQQSPATRMVLSPPEFAAVQVFRQQWCQQMPVFRPLAQGETFHDLAFECGGYTTKQAKVPEGMLPPIIQVLVQRLPRPTS